MNTYKNQLLGYNKPTAVIEHPAKIAVVMATFVPEGKKELVSGRAPLQNNYYEFFENKFDMIKFSIACHEKYDAGVDFELIIVDNSSPDPDTHDLLENSNHKFFVRPNSGFSFGSYKYIWETFGDKYDYYLFHEQDIIPCRNNWLSDLVLKFLSNREIGAVGNCSEGPRSIGFFDNRPSFKAGFTGDYWAQESWTHCNLDGAYAFTSSTILKKCGLNVIDMTLDSNNNWSDDPCTNELFWLHSILNSGYKIDGYYNGQYLATSGICYVELDSNLPLAPMIHAQTLYCSDFAKKHFSWYPNINDFESGIRV